MSENSTAAKRLAKLEAAILDGQTVTPAELAEARAAAELEQLQAEGARRRSEAAALREQQARRKQAKTDAAELLAEHSLDAALTAFDAAVEAVEHLMQALGAHNDAVQRATHLLLDARVPTAPAGVSPKVWPDTVDRENYVAVRSGRPERLVVAGTAYNEQTVDQWVGSLFGYLARKHHVQTPGGSKLATVLGDLASGVWWPVPLVDHLQAA